MARRKKTNAGKAAAAAAKAKSLKKANGQPTDSGSKDKVELDESLGNQEDSETRPPPPTSRIVEICPDRTLTPTPQVIPVDIVHKKFGKLRCLVETEVVSREQSPKDRFDDPKQSDTPSITEASESLGDISEIVWEEEVVEETIVCEEIEMDIEEGQSDIGLMNKEFSQLPETDSKLNEDESNGSEINVPSDSSVIKKVPEASSSSAIFSQKIDEFKEEEITVYKRDDFDCVSTSESEITSREEDSQDSQKVSESDVDVSKVAQLMEQAKLVPMDVDNAVSINIQALGRRQLRSSVNRTARHLTIPAVSKSPKAGSKKTPTVNVPIAGDIMNPVLNDCLKTKLNDIHLEQQSTFEIITETIEVIEDKCVPTTVLDTIMEESVNLVEKFDIQPAVPETPPKISTLKAAEEEVSVESKPQTPTFRSRSGSTDTTGSESSSNCSSIVRRSSRIRSISTTKQRTKNRFQALKATAEEAKVADSRDSSDNNSGTETFSDRENNISTKMPVPMSSLCISNPPGGKQQDVNFKPVKVKSRWRRSSELEMVGNRNSDSDAVAGPPTPSHSPLLGAPRTPTSSPRPPAFVAPAAAASPTQPSAEEVAAPTDFSLKKDPRVDRKLREDKDMEERLRQFENLTENHYLTERSTCKEFRGMVCDCFLTKDEVARGELGCGEDCLNRLLMIECGSRCTLGDRCTNKHFQKQEYSKCEVFKTEKKGYGLRATEDLPSGAFLLEYVGEVVNAKEFRRRAKEYSKDKNRHYYFMALKSDSVIDATMKGNISRFINHSCDPNAETQKWTVNGELRIGFFTSKSVAAWEELTFDYQFQRYGKEAQRCHCESALCRGWIGEDPEKEKEKAERKEKKDQEVSKKKREEVKHVEPEEEDSDEIDTNLEHDIEELCLSGLKNRNHTLSLCRLMVRSQDSQSRAQLLQLIQRGEPACLRLFLDYHGLRLISKWMSDIDGVTETSLALRTEILQTLGKLPIQNKTVLQDSKVLNMVEKWIVAPVISPSRDGPTVALSATIEPKVERISPTEGSQDSVFGVTTPPEEPKVTDIPDTKTSPISEIKIPGILDTDEVAVINEEINDLPSAHSFVLLATSLLAEWSNLKEVFRIPKKERIEQMKEHEREADRGYKEYLDKEDTQSSKQSYDRHWRQRSADTDKNRKKAPNEVEKIRKSRFDDRCIVQIPGLSKEERRLMFAMKVAKEEEEERQRKLVEEAGERHRKGLEEQWRIHEEQCRALEVDPNTTAFDWETGCMAVFDPSTGNWIQYPPLDQHLNNMGQNPEMGTPQILISNNPQPSQFNQQFDPNQPYNLSNPHYHPNNQMPPYGQNYNINPQFDLNHPMNAQQFDPNNQMNQFSNNPSWDYPPHFNQNNPDNVHHYPPNNPMHPQFNPHDPMNPVFNSNNPMNTQYNPNNPLNPGYMNSQYDPNHVMNSQFHHADGQHLGSLPPPEPPASVDYEPPPLPYDSSDPPSNTCLIPVKITPNACLEDSKPPEESKAEVVFPPLPPDLLQVPLPPNWKSAKDNRGYVYYYHTEERVSRWKPPWELLDPDADFELASEGSEDDEEDDVEEGDSALEEDEEGEDGDEVMEDAEGYDAAAMEIGDGDHLVAEKNATESGSGGVDVCSEVQKELDLTDCDDQELDSQRNEECEDFGLTEGQETESVKSGEPALKKAKLESGLAQPITSRPEETKKRREGLVQERIISPRCKEDRPEKTNYRVIKEKLLQRKKQQARKSRSKKKRHDREGKPRLSRKSEKAVAVESADNSGEAARKIKDNFRLQMAGAIVQYLNPFRKQDCTQGRITKTEDFKHLARKLTHFVMLKELKHCQNVDDLVCNDSVKHKARDFIRKYMSKFGTLYQRPIDDD